MRPGLLFCACMLRDVMLFVFLFCLAHHVTLLLYKHAEAFLFLNPCQEPTSSQILPHSFMPKNLSVEEPLCRKICCVLQMGTLSSWLPAKGEPKASCPWSTLTPMCATPPCVTPRVPMMSSFLTWPCPSLFWRSCRSVLLLFHLDAPPATLIDPTCNSHRQPPQTLPAMPRDPTFYSHSPHLQPLRPQTRPWA